MTRGLRTASAATLVAAFIALLLPATAEAQGRRAVPRVIRSRPAVSVGIYYGPRVYYRPWYAAGYSWYDPYYSSYYSPYYYSQWPPYYGRGFDVSAALRLQVSPRQAEVFIDGYFAGTVDDFDGVFQRLHLEPGEHDLEVYLPGHRTLQQKVYLQPGRSFSIRHTMEPLAAGDPEPARPTASTTRSTAPQARAPRGVPRITQREREPDQDQEPVEPATVGTRSEFGSLSLRVQPGDASITIDGEVWESSGDNERFIVQLGAGLHNVEIRKDGYRAYITDITVRPGSTTTLNVALTPSR